MIYGVVGTLDRDTMMKFGLFNMKTGRFTRPASKKGNGKTMVLVYYGYLEHKEQGRKVYSNFHTVYSIYKTAQEIFDDLGRILDLAGKFGAYGTIQEIIKNFDHIFAQYPLTQVEQTELYELRSLYHEYFGCLILLTEFQKFFNSLGTSTKTIKWIEGILTQLRKLEIDLMWDSQRPISAGNRSREYTETYLVPQKFHLDDMSPCDQDICDSGPDREHIIKVFSDVPFRENELVTLVCKEVGKLYETNEIIGDHLCSPVEKTPEEKEKARKKSSKRKQQEQDPASQVPEIPKEPVPAPLDIPVQADPVDEPDPEPVRVLIKPKVKKQIEPDHDISMLLDSEPLPTDEDIMDLEVKMLLESGDVPFIVKEAIRQIHKEPGPIHAVFLKYFTEEGTPILPYALDELHGVVNEVISK